jgi:hypothetical protein
MKKISIVLIIAIVCSTLFSVAYADANQVNPTPTNANSSISISFKIGDEILKINGKEIKVVKPYAINGNTLVPLRVITEAFGAEVKWEPNDNSITVSLNDVAIKLLLNKTEAVINGQKITVAAAPIAISGTTMVPLRFITENFGAEVSFNNTTKEITVTKEMVSDNSIKDFSEVLNSNAKDRVGDSYYKWSINLPEDFVVTTRNYVGDYNTFANRDEDEFLYIEIRDKKNETLEYLWQNEAILSIEGNETIVENKIIDINGMRCERIVFKDHEGIYERRLFINGDKIYTVGLELYDTSLKNTDGYKKYMDSFKLSFSDIAITKDLSDIDADGYRSFNSKDLGFTFSVPLDWEWKDNEENNYISFVEPSTANGLGFYMYSKETDLTFDKVVDKQKQFIKNEYDPSYVKIENEERTSINGMNAAILTTSWRYNSKTVYTIDALLMGKDYCYELRIMMDEKSYNQTANKTKIDHIIKSIKTSEPNPEDVGVLYDKTDVLRFNKLYEVTGAANKWSFKVPMNWLKVETQDPNNEYVYKEVSQQLYFTFLVRAESSTELVSLYENAVSAAEKTGTFKNISKDILYEKGATVYKYTNTFVKGDFNLTEYYYIIDKGGKTYVTYSIMADMRKSDKNLELFNDMWDSITLN